MLVAVKVEAVDSLNLEEVDRQLDFLTEIVWFPYIQFYLE
jgi:hypothetical protein